MIFANATYEEARHQHGPRRSFEGHKPLAYSSPDGLAGMTKQRGEGQQKEADARRSELDPQGK